MYEEKNGHMREDLLISVYMHVANQMQTRGAEAFVTLALQSGVFNIVLSGSSSIGPLTACSSTVYPSTVSVPAS
jgi:hypothetical protein